MDNQGLEKTKLLLVEDDEDFCYALSMRLAKRGFEITAAATAEEALTKLDGQTFDVVVADIKLPGMNGMEFLAKIRERKDDLPVIMITGYASLESAKEAVKLKANDYILKPLENIDELLNPINKAVHSYRLTLENKKLTDILKDKIKELERSELSLREQKISLEQKNIALKEILEQIELEKKRIKDDVCANVEKLLLPAVKKLKGKTASSGERQIDLIERNLGELVTSFGRKISEKSLALTPREIEICNMIKNGFTSKEISEQLNLSLQTIERHRNNIRRKFGIVNKDINLTTYLQML